MLNKMLALSIFNFFFLASLSFVKGEMSNKPKNYLSKDEASKYKKKNSFYPKYNVIQMDATKERIKNREIKKSLQNYENLEINIERSKKYHTAQTKKEVEEYLLSYHTMLGSSQLKDDEVVEEVGREFIDGYPIVDMSTYGTNFPSGNMYMVRRLKKQGKIPGHSSIRSSVKEYNDLYKKRQE